MAEASGLIRVLLDETARTDERDDAAKDLGGFDGVDVEAALGRVGADSSAPEIVQASCGESLGQIWKRRGGLDKAIFGRLSPIAKREAEAAYMGQTMASPRFEQRRKP